MPDKPTPSSSSSSSTTMQWMYDPNTIQHTEEDMAEDYLLGRKKIADEKFDEDYVRVRKGALPGGNFLRQERRNEFSASVALMEDPMFKIEQLQRMRQQQQQQQSIATDGKKKNEKKSRKGRTTNDEEDERRERKRSRKSKHRYGEERNHHYESDEDRYRNRDRRYDDNDGARRKGEGRRRRERSRSPRSDDDDYHRQRYERDDGRMRKGSRRHDDDERRQRESYSRDQRQRRERRYSPYRGDKSHHHPSDDDGDMQRKLQEMIQAGKDVQEQRMQRLSEEIAKSAERRDKSHATSSTENPTHGNPTFLHKVKQGAYLGSDDMNLEARIKRNVHSIQRSSHALARDSFRK